MPNKKSAAKQMRQSIKKRERNRTARGAFRTTLKKTDKVFSEGNAEQSAAQLQETLKMVGKTEKKGLIHKNKAARHASRLTKKLHAIQAGSAKEPAGS